MCHAFVCLFVVFRERLSTITSIVDGFGVVPSYKCKQLNHTNEVFDTK